jgi:hypothetical protein
MTPPERERPRGRDADHVPALPPFARAAAPSHRLALGLGPPTAARRLKDFRLHSDLQTRHDIAAGAAFAVGVFGITVGIEGTRSASIDAYRRDPWRRRKTRVSRAIPYSYRAAPTFAPLRNTSAASEVIASLIAAAPKAPV